MDIVAPEIDRYAEQHSTPPPDYMQRLADETRQLPRAGMLTGPLEGGFLQMLVHMANARNVLEIGTFTGFGTLSMAAAVPADGQVITCDVDPDAVAIARRYIDESGLADRIDIRMGNALDTIATLEGPFDFVFIDADKTNYLNYYEAVLPKLAPRGVIAVDNVLWGGRVLDPEGEAGTDGEEDTRAIAEFNERVRADERVTAVMVPIRDGVTLIRKR